MAPVRRVKQTAFPGRMLRSAVVFAGLAFAPPLACMAQASVANQSEPVFRSPFELKLRVDKDHYYDQKFERVPYVADGDVYLFIGEHFGVNVTVAGDGISQIVYQPDVKKADIEFKLTQEKAPGGFMMLLVTHNKLDRKLFFDALMTVPGKQGVYKTSVLPVEAKLSNYESWPNPIVQLVLRNFRFSPAN